MVDAEKILAEIRRLKTELQGYSAQEALDYIESYINLIGREPLLSTGIDEAAEEYAFNNWEDNDYHTGASEGLPFDAIGHTANCFKAGAKRMAEQGVILNLSIDELSCGAYNACVEQGLTSEDDVIVQIRKK